MVPSQTAQSPQARAADRSSCGNSFSSSCPTRKTRQVSLGKAPMANSSSWTPTRSPESGASARTSPTWTMTSLAELFVITTTRTSWQKFTERDTPTNSTSKDSLSSTSQSHLTLKRMPRPHTSSQALTSMPVSLPPRRCSHTQQPTAVTQCPTGRELHQPTPSQDRCTDPPWEQEWPTTLRFYKIYVRKKELYK